MSSSCSAERDRLDALQATLRTARQKAEQLKHSAEEDTLDYVSSIKKAHASHAHGASDYKQHATTFAIGELRKERYKQRVRTSQAAAARNLENIHRDSDAYEKSVIETRRAKTATEASRQNVEEAIGELHDAKARVQNRRRQNVKEAIGELHIAEARVQNRREDTQNLKRQLHVAGDALQAETTGLRIAEQCVHKATAETQRALRSVAQANAGYIREVTNLAHDASIAKELSAETTRNLERMNANIRQLQIEERVANENAIRCRERTTP